MFDKKNLMFIIQNVNKKMTRDNYGLNILKSDKFFIDILRKNIYINSNHQR